MTYFKKMIGFMRPYMVMYSLGVFLYNTQGFIMNFVIGLVGSSVIAGAVVRDTEKIVTGSIITISILIGSLSLVGVGIYIGNKARVNAELDLKQTLFRCFIKNDLETSQSSHSGEGIAAINTEADTAMGLWWYELSNLLRPLITVIFSLVTIFITDWRIGISAVALGLFSYFIQSRFVKPLANIGKERLDANADAVRGISDIFQGALSIRAFNMQDKALDHAGSNMGRLKLLSFRQAFITMWQKLFTTLQGWLTLIITFGFGGWLVATERLEFPVLFLVLPLIQGVSDAMGNIGQAIAALQIPLVAAERIFAIIDNIPVSNRSASTSIKTGSVELDGISLHIKDLNFQYLNTGHDTLHNIDLDINIGEMVAFVGPSGSGKSTILRIIVGFYERENLGMTLGGTSSDKINISAWRDKFAYVDQSCKLFDMTIKENIAMGRKGKASDTEVVSAAKQAFAHDFIEELTEKYDSPCGEKGNSLSGGQKQRIAIARALIKGSPILVFDEATAALDADSEKYVMDTIESLRCNHTILITTHNLLNIITADKIVVMDDGRIVEVGKHDDLMEKKGLYFDLFSCNQ